MIGWKKEPKRLMRYDPHKHVDADAWLELDESRRTHRAFQYHRRKRVLLPHKVSVLSSPLETE